MEEGMIKGLQLLFKLHMYLPLLRFDLAHALAFYQSVAKIGS